MNRCYNCIILHVFEYVYSLYFVMVYKLFANLFIFHRIDGVDLYIVYSLPSLDRPWCL